MYRLPRIRPHASCDYLTPEQAHLESGVPKKRWKPKKYKQKKNNTCIARTEITDWGI